MTQPTPDMNDPMRLIGLEAVALGLLEVDHVDADGWLVFRKKETA